MDENVIAKVAGRQDALDDCRAVARCGRQR
jgi:hypothetical protein